jgi:hypothetical protein
MDDITMLIAGAALGLIVLAIGAFLAYKRFSKKPAMDILMEMSGELKLNYYPETEGRPPFATGTYSGRGLTLDVLNEKGYADRWHPHARIVVSVDKNIKETYIVANRGRFYSRKLGEVRVNYPSFEDKYQLLSSNPKKGELLLTPEVACWIVGLDMPFYLSDGHIQFHQDRHFDDKTRFKHIIDALVYLAAMAERLK